VATIPGQSFTDYMRMVDDQRHGRNLDGDLVEATWLLADVDGVVVGRSWPDIGGVPLRRYWID
jgi:predicted acetyltransferase